MKLFFHAFNYKILYLTILIVCRKNLSDNENMDCKIIVIEGEKKVFLMGSRGEKLVRERGARSGEQGAGSRDFISNFFEILTTMARQTFYLG
jgi:hypothetical protein